MKIKIRPGGASVPEEDDWLQTDDWLAELRDDGRAEPAGDGRAQPAMQAIYAGELAQARQGERTAETRP